MISAEREKEARIILGSSEQPMAQTFVDAAEIYATRPAAMQLRAMNLFQEAIRERGMATVVPSGTADGLNPEMIAMMVGVIDIERYSNSQ